MVYTVIGLVLTLIGIVFTILGTVSQGKENKDFQDESIKKTDQIENLTTQVYSLSTDIKEMSGENIQLSTQNKELTDNLIKLNKESFRKITIPELNVVTFTEVSPDSEDAYFKLIVRNTGNNDCTNARIIIDSHNSPYWKSMSIANYQKFPKDSELEYRIPLFRTSKRNLVLDNALKDEYEVYRRKYLDGLPVLISFHFEYEWKNEILRSSNYTILKVVAEKGFLSIDVSPPKLQ